MIERIQRIPVVVLLLPLLVGILWCNYSPDSNLLDNTEFAYIDSVRYFKVTVTDYPSSRKKTDRYEVRILAIADSTAELPLLAQTTGHVYLYVRRDSTRLMPRPGDTLWVHTSIHRGQQMGDFDYGLYLRRQGIIGYAYVSSRQWQLVRHGKLNPWNPLVWQHSLVSRYHQLGFSDMQAAILSALTLGYKEDLDDDVRRSFQKSGAAHVLAVSGLHTGIIYTVLIFLLNGFGLYPPLYENRRRRYINGCVCIALLWLYALLTNMTPSVVRSVIMCSLWEIAYMTYRQPIGFNTLFTTAFFILCFRPNDLFSVSFQLSFAAVFAIVFCANYLPAITLPKTIAHTLWRKVFLYFLGIIVVSFVAQLGVMPITLYYFGQTSNYFLLTNLLVIPLVWLIVMGAFILLTIGWIPGVGEMIAYPLKWLVQLLYDYVSWIENLSGAITSIHTSRPMVVCLYVAILSSILTISKSRWWLLPTGISLSLFCYLYTL